MQLILALDDRSGTIGEIHRRLCERFGRPNQFLRPDPVSQLILGILGARTRSHISMAAFEALWACFGCWEKVRDAPVAEIRELIAAVTYADVKAVHLKATLEFITTARGRLTLEFLERETVNDALYWLERLPGVGRKVAAATLNFSTLRKAALVIDTHHLRVLRRLRLVGRRCTLMQAYEHVMPILPAGWTAEDLDEHHHLMKTHGQTICRHARPVCRCCPLRDLCPGVVGSAG